MRRNLRSNGRATRPVRERNGRREVRTVTRAGSMHEKRQCPGLFLVRTPGRMFVAATRDDSCARGDARCGATSVPERRRRRADSQRSATRRGAITTARSLHVRG